MATGENNNMYYRTRSDDPDTIRRERDQLKRDLADARDREEREREEARREHERRERYEEQRRTASTWKEALDKQAGLMMREYHQYPELYGEEQDNYFQTGAEACQRALTIWAEIEPEYKAQIQALEEQIDALHTHLRQEVGKKLRAERQTTSHGWENVADALNGDEYADPSDWLNW